MQPPKSPPSSLGSHQRRRDDWGDRRSWPPEELPNAAQARPLSPRGGRQRPWQSSQWRRPPKRRLPPSPPAKLKPEREKRASNFGSGFLHPLHHSSTITAPDDRNGYMAASRRSPLIYDQWQQAGDDPRTRHRPRERDHRPRRHDSRSPPPRAVAAAAAAPPAAAADLDRELPRPRDRDGDAQEHPSRPHPRSRERPHHYPERSHRREEEAEERRRPQEEDPELSAARHARRPRHREHSPAAEEGEEARRHRHEDERRRHHHSHHHYPEDERRHHRHEHEASHRNHSDEAGHRHRSHHRSERRPQHREYGSRGEREHVERSPRRHSRERPSGRSREDYPASLVRHERYQRSSEHEHAGIPVERAGRSSHRHHRDRSTDPSGYEYAHAEESSRRPSSRDEAGYYGEEHNGHHRRPRRDSPPRHRHHSERDDWARERERSPSRRGEKAHERSYRHGRDRHEGYDSGRDEARSRSPRDRERRMQSTRPIQSILDDHPRRQSPPRPIPSFDDGRNNTDEQMREQFPMHGMKASDVHNSHRRAPPHIDTRAQYSGTPYGATPTSSQHGSPHSGSPYSGGRGAGWNNQPPHYMSHGQHMNAYSPPYRQNSYPPPNGHHGQYYGASPHHGYQQPSPGYHTPPYRGGHPPQGGMRGGYSHPPDRRFSGGSTGPQPPVSGSITPTRGRGGHFQNLHWNANGNARGGRPGDAAPRGAATTPTAAMPPEAKPEREEEEENPFRPSKDFRVEDQGSKEAEVDSGAVQAENAAQSAQDDAGEDSQPSREASKFSFAFKAKPAPPPAAKPLVQDLTRKMKEPPPPPPPRKDVFHDASRKPPPPRLAREEQPRHRSERRPDAWDERRGDWREREYDHRYGRKEPTDYRHERRPDRPQREPPRAPEKVLEKRMVKKIMKRPRQKPRLEGDFKASDSVYFRKGGNESVVGSGTYGKVYKGIHVFTKGLVALKKIRMEGERDGFPITAVRELKLLQSLRHENVVSLLETMVERNDCFMVFEYLSHDLTGLLNHPTFSLEHTHKKDLARQLFQGLDYLHKRGVLHRDIKAANILVSNTGQLKIADFGLARFYAKRQQLDYTNRVITIWYRPPELLLGETQYGPAVDVWSAACVLVEIFTKHAIFAGDGGEISQLDKVYSIMGTPTTKEWPNVVDMAWFELLRPTERKPSVFEEKYKHRVTPAAYELLQSMLLYDPAKRPSASDVLEHPYFTTEDPLPKQATELKDLPGEWHEFESKALRRENERRDKEARRQQRIEEHEREKAKRRASSTTGAEERDAKRARPSGEEVDVDMK